MAGVLAINGLRGAGGLLPSRGRGRFIKRRIKGGRAKEAGESGRWCAAVQSRGGALEVGGETGRWGPCGCGREGEKEDGPVVVRWAGRGKQAGGKRLGRAGRKGKERWWAAERRKETGPG
jgi:hypothetical protein